MGCKKSFCAILSGSQEVPPVQTNASGFVKATLKGHTLIVKGRFQGLSSAYVAAHVHGASLPGTNSGVLFTLNATLNPGNLSGKFSECQNRFGLTDAQIQQLKDGLFYVNIHTSQFPNGEIRGQLLPKEGDCCKQYVVVLSGANEVPPVETDATGTIVASLHCRTLTLSGSFQGLSSAFTGAHIHEGAVGVNGPVLYTLTVVTLLPNTAGDLLRASNSFQLTKQQLAALKAGNLYINVHSVNFPGGEIRGQIQRL